VTHKTDMDGGARRIALVLGSGGFRGPAHVGVLARLREIRIPIHAVIGCSVGSLIAAFYAGAGASIDDLLESAQRTTLLGILAHSWALRRRGRAGRLAARWAEPVRRHLHALEAHDFRRLHHGVQQIGFLIHDRRRGERIFAVTGRERGFTLAEAVRASSRLPVLFPPLRKQVDGLERRLVDGAFSAPTPVIHAVAAPISATHVIVVDITKSRRRGRLSELDRWQRLLGERLLVLRPRPAGGLRMWGKPGYIRAWFEAGRGALGSDEEKRLRAWMEREPRSGRRTSGRAAEEPTCATP
jgi:NTE family protein